MTENIDTHDTAVVTRFAPSPTGSLHIGGVRTALFSYLYARQHPGRFILRIEDTDQERSKKEHEDEIVEVLEWLSMPWDEFYRQSERNEIYTTHIKTLLENGSAYISKEEDVGEGKRSEVIRFKNPNSTVSFKDRIRGEVSFDTTDLGDFVIARSETEPLYHLTVVVDDLEMGVTDVIRGEEHISNTPRQILIQNALGFSAPRYAHIPLILAPDRSKLSKRHGAVSALDFREKGYLPDALKNYLALLGWNPGTDQEIFTEKELIEAFDVEKIQKGGAIFNEEKLAWVNKAHMEFVRDDRHRDELIRRIRENGRDSVRGWELDSDHLMRVWETIKDRVSVYSEIAELIEGGELDMYFEAPEYEKEGLLWKETDPETIRTHLQHALEVLSGLDETAFDQSTVKDALWEYATEQGRGEVLWPLRFALSGKERSPDPFSIAGVIGKDETCKRIETALEKLSEK